MMIPLANIIALVGLVPLFILGPSKVASSAPLSAPIPQIMNANWTLGAFHLLSHHFRPHGFKSLQDRQTLSVRSKKGWLPGNGLSRSLNLMPLMKAGHCRQRRPIDPQGFLIDRSTVRPLISHLNLTAKRGQIIGITGPIASGKSAFTKVFSQALPYEGSALLFGQELSAYSPAELAGTVITMPHKNELFTDTIDHNIRLGGEEPTVAPYLDRVAFKKDLESMPLKEQTLVGNEGVKLSGGQQERLCLARTLYERKPLMILDDPFASVDPKDRSGNPRSSPRRRWRFPRPFRFRIVFLLLPDLTK
jgi:ABC-type multidrug transport system fused ATPase/permease subunit